MQTTTYPRDAVAFTGGAVAVRGRSVERTAAGLPKAFRVLPFGPFSYTQEGRRQHVALTRDMGADVVRHFALKGEPIPIDCEHFTYHLANALGCEEQELLRTLPGERPAAGFAELALREDGLWAVNVQWVPRAALFLTEKLYRYFSPVIRGLRSGRLRVTSIALTNNPALDHLEQLVASAEQGTIAAHFGVDPARLQQLLPRVSAVALTASDREAAAAIGIPETAMLAEKIRGDLVAAAAARPALSASDSEVARRLGIGVDTMLRARERGRA